MRPRRTPTTTEVLVLQGGNEDHDIWVRRGEHEAGEGPYRGAWIESVWTLGPEERELVAAGANIVLRVSGTRHPPVGLYLTDEQAGRA